jgi:predicted ABC-type ATPase
MPTLYIIAGPNGVGKTTFANSYLPDEAKQVEFVNADLL